MRLVIDVNFPPSLAESLSGNNVEAVHWTSVGAATAPDVEILKWARDHDHIVLTQDLDYPELLATTGADAPSVILIRRADALGRDLSEAVLDAVEQCGNALRRGAIVVLDVGGRRTRTLPIE